MALATTPDGLPYPTGPDMPDVAADMEDLAAAAQVALTKRTNTINVNHKAAMDAATGAQDVAASAFAGLVARHRQTTARAMAVSASFVPAAVAERQYGWTGSQRSGDAVRLWSIRKGVYIVGGALAYAAPPSGAAIMGVREGVLARNGAPIQSVSVGVNRPTRTSDVAIPTDMVYLDAGESIEIQGRHGQDVAVDYTALLWAAYVGLLP